MSLQAPAPRVQLRPAPQRVLQVGVRRSEGSVRLPHVRCPPAMLPDILPPLVDLGLHVGRYLLRRDAHAMGWQAFPRVSGCFAATARTCVTFIATSSCRSKRQRPRTRLLEVVPRPRQDARRGPEGVMALGETEEQVVMVPVQPIHISHGGSGLSSGLCARLSTCWHVGWPGGPHRRPSPPPDVPRALHYVVKRSETAATLESQRGRLGNTATFTEGRGGTTASAVCVHALAG